jgi:valyl-tRNA synthetase
MDKIMEAIRAIRARRAEMNVPPSRRAQVYIETEEKETFTAGIPFMKRLASASDVLIGVEPAADSITIVTDGARIFIPMGELVDYAAERARLENEKKKLLAELDRVKSKLANEGFMAKAPASLVEEERGKLSKFEEMLARVDESLAKLP